MASKGKSGQLDSEEEESVLTVGTEKTKPTARRREVEVAAGKTKTDRKAYHKAYYENKKKEKERKKASSAASSQRHRDKKKREELEAQLVAEAKEDDEVETPSTLHPISTTHAARRHGVSVLLYFCCTVFLFYIAGRML